MAQRTQHSKACGLCKLSPGAPQGAPESHLAKLNARKEALRRRNSLGEPGILRDLRSKL
jgi:hypothetical protein